MANLISPPPGLTEAEEAEWWFENRQSVEAEFILAFDEGRVRRRAPQDLELEVEARRLAAAMHLDSDDLQKARVAAEKRGMPFPDYLRTLVHEGLQRESTAA